MHWSITAPWISDPEKDNWLEPWVLGDDHDFTLIASPELNENSWQSGRSRPLRRLMNCSHASARAVRARKSGGVIALFPPLATAVAAIKTLTYSDFPIVAWDFNLGATPTGLKRWVAQRVLQNVDCFVVHSNWEREQYSRCFDIPLDRFRFVPLQRPMPATLPENRPEGTFVLAMGTAQRDYATLFEALKRTDYPAVVVSGALALEDLEVPNNVTIKQKLPYEECRQLLTEARFSVVPVKVGSGASGQVTIVDAMARGCALIVTKCPGLIDYIQPEETGLFYDPQDVTGLVRQMERLWTDTVLRNRLEKQAFAYAVQHLSEQAVADKLRIILDELA